MSALPPIATAKADFRTRSCPHGHGSEDLLYRGWRNIRDSGAGAFVADFTGLARGNWRLDNTKTNMGEVDWCRRHGSLELFRIAARYASLIG
jgi:hypothetical protein